MVTSAPRLALSAIASSQGKTTVTIGLLGALRARGLVAQSFKVGPDFIDPGFHELASGRRGRNLDPHLCGEERLVPLLLHGAAGADVSIIEGVMGLFDGRLGTSAPGGGGWGSTAHVAAVTRTPVVMVVDVARLSRTIGPLVAGLAAHDPDVTIAGVILNRAGSPRAIAELERALSDEGLPVVGCLPRDQSLQTPSRHLGLVPATERDESRDALAAAARLVGDHVDLDALLALAATAPSLEGEAWDPTAEVTPVADRPRIAVATGRAFTFRYAETDELLRAAGCEPIAVDPLTDAALPDGTAGLMLGGGFPEEYATALAANTALRAHVADAIKAGLPTWAECAGMLYLCRTLGGEPMVGILDVDAALAPGLVLHYDEVELLTDTLIGPAGARVRTHEFHKTRCTGDPCNAFGLPDGGAEGWSVDPAGVGRPTLLATYQHLHPAGTPGALQAFAEACARHATTARQEPDLHHHGDRDARPGLVNLAVNVRDTRPPQWLRDAVLAGVDGWGAYPDASPARSALAAFHGVDVDEVLPTAGGAEAFTLIARAFSGRALIVHPQFTEPEQALRQAGWEIRRLVLTPEEEFRVDVALPRADLDVDLVVVGNPTNPTGILHPGAALRRLAGPGRILLVDEAFADAVPGEPESLIQAGKIDGVLVVRSLTKTWSMAGLRAGYVVGDAALIRRLAEVQPPWSVPTPAVDAMVACASERARAEADAWARSLVEPRARFVAALRARGLRVVGAPATPFVLVDTAPTGRLHLREALADAGFATRRGDTFPGLGPTWLRLAQRDDHTLTAFLTALDTLLKEPQ